MKVRNAYLIYCFVLIGLLLNACKPDAEQPKPDTTKPTIKVLSPAGLDTTVAAGQVLKAKIEFKDDRALGSTKIEIHNVFDGHGHGKGAATPFSFDTTLNLTGTMQILDFSLGIPGTAVSGPYHLIINCLDKEGNEADFVEIDLLITNNSSPEIKNILIDNSQLIDYMTLFFNATTDSLIHNLKADLSDNDGLDSLKLILIESGHSHGKRAIVHDSDEPIFKIAKALSNSPTSYVLNEDLVFHKNKLEKDHFYTLFIYLRDKKGNYARAGIGFEVKKN